MTEFISAQGPSRILSVPTISSLSTAETACGRHPHRHVAWIARNRIFTNGDLGIRLSNGGNSAIPAPVIQSTTFGLYPHRGFSLPRLRRTGIQQPIPRRRRGILSGGRWADAAGNYALVVGRLAYPYLTATATHDRGTSEFSAVFTSTAYPLNLPLILR